MEWTAEAYKQAIAKVCRTSGRIQDVIPYTTQNGVYNDQTTDPGWWTNGFWSGILWLMYYETGEERFTQYARGCEDIMDTVLHNFDRFDHDAGFMWHLSSVADYQLTGFDSSRKRGLLAASLLASRFHLKGGFIRAWNDKDGAPDRRGWAIIDCMMNLPILYWASQVTKDLRFRYIAMAHADTTLKYFIREDGSVKHIVSFDPVTGEMLESLGGQGYDVNSSWSRGTAWALYGFALSCYFTGEERYLQTAKRIANFYIAALPEDGVPFADFKAPEETNVHKDTSAGACGASGLLLLADLVSENEKEIYRKAGKKIIKSLYENYTTDDQKEEALLKNGCVSFHNSKANDITLIYGDYFYMEALAQLNGRKPLFCGDKNLSMDTFKKE